MTIWVFSGLSIKIVDKAKEVFRAFDSGSKDDGGEADPHHLLIDLLVLGQVKFASTTEGQLLIVSPLVANLINPGHNFVSFDFVWLIVEP